MSQQDRQPRRLKRRIARERRVRRIQGVPDEPLPTALLRCSQAFVRPVPRLRKRYSPETVVLAMLSQSAAYLRCLREERLFTRKQTLQVCREFKTYVLQDPTRRQ